MFWEACSCCFLSSPFFPASRRGEKKKKTLPSSTSSSRQARVEKKWERERKGKGEAVFNLIAL